MYDSVEVAERVRIVARERGQTLASVFSQAKLDKSTLTDYSRGSMPKADNLAKIADALDCSVDYLLGRTDRPEINR